MAVGELFSWLLPSHASFMVLCLVPIKVQHAKIRALWFYAVAIAHPKHFWWHHILCDFYHWPEGPFLLLLSNMMVEFLWFKVLPEELALNLWDIILLLPLGFFSYLHFTNAFGTTHFLKILTCVAAFVFCFVFFVSSFFTLIIVCCFIFIIPCFHLSILTIYEITIIV